MYESDWIFCPLCGNKTRDKIRADTTMKNFPVFCPKCKQEILINVEQFQITVIQEPAAVPMNLQMMQILGSAAFLYTTNNKEEAVKSLR